MNRRDFLKLAGLISGSAVAACDLQEAPHRLVPYLVPPDEGIVPGTPRYVRSTCTECPAGCGLLVKIMDDRPVKLEGNPDHPINRGALCVRGQAGLGRLYQPERLRRPRLREPDGRWINLKWNHALGRLRAALEDARRRGLTSVLLSGRTTGSLGRLIREGCTELGLERWPELEILHHGALRQATRLVFGSSGTPRFRLDRADLVISLGAGLLDTFPNPVETARWFARGARRGLHWIHLEPHLTLTGLRASERWFLPPGSEAALLLGLLHHARSERSLPEVLAAVLPPPSNSWVAAQTGLPAERIRELEHRLSEARAPLVLAGGVATASPNGLRTALLAALVQWTSGMDRNTLELPAVGEDEGLGTLANARELARELEAGRIGVVIQSRLHGLELVPELARALGRASYRAALTDLPTGVPDGWDLLLPASHALESWGDRKVRPGLLSLIQPALEPLGDTLSEGDVWLRLLQRESTYQGYLLERWRGFGEGWLDRGVHEIRPPDPGPPTPDHETVARLLAAASQEEPVKEGLILEPSLRSYDGRSRPIQLLQEVPDPLATVSYGQWLALSEEEGRRLGLEDGRVVDLECEAGSLALPVRLQPGLPSFVRALALEAAGGLDLPISQASGELRRVLGGVRITPRPVRRELPILTGSVDHGRERGLLGPRPGHRAPPGHDQLYGGHPHESYRWAMVIDLDLCTGCSACVAACFLENNVPLVGPAEHRKGREMSWLRIQPYRDGRGGLSFLPMMCQHCDQAPCETVCPVYATYHNPEGLNAQVYNRCVGTRYCANNCPYKVRRFNWLAHPRPAPLDRMINPEVSERPKGVMEKCTFCLQRIRAARDRAGDEGRRIRDGEVVPACAQTCPTGAIQFGNLEDPGSRVAKQASNPRAYRVLEELGTHPAVIYLHRRNTARGAHHG